MYVHILSMHYTSSNFSYSTLVDYALFTTVHTVYAIYISDLYIMYSASFSIEFSFLIVRAD